MTYLEIVEALGKGLNVHWMNTGYKVTLGSLGLLHVTFIAMAIIQSYKTLNIKIAL